MVKRLASHQVLQHLQDIESDCSDGEFSDSENPLENNIHLWWRVTRNTL